MNTKVLEFVNELRSEMNLEPLSAILPGDLRSGTHCPIANSIKSGAEMQYEVLVSPRFVKVLDWTNPLPTARRTTPTVVQDWIYEFDNGGIPELIA